MRIDLDLASIGASNTLKRITATGVPGRGGPADRIVHLIIDCVYDEILADLGPSQLLAQARADTVAILRHCVTQRWFGKFKAVSVRFLFPELSCSHSWLRQGVRKVYVYYVETEGFPTNPQGIEIHRLPEYPRAVQHSESEVICRLLTSNR